MNDILLFVAYQGNSKLSIHIFTLFGLAILLAACTKANTPNLLENQSTHIVEDSTLTSAQDVGPYWLATDDGNVKLFPNLWTNISPDKIQQYTFSLPIESTIGKDGSNWYIGPFGIIWQKTDGSQILFSNGPPNSYDFPAGGDFRLITVGPDGQVWVGGRNKILYRFDGKEWVNEGKMLPDASGKPNWLCYSKQIIAIDFDQDGFTWVLTAEMEIYHLVDGQWINFPNHIPDQFMPVAGGGACPQGMRVYSPQKIIIKRSGCCEMPDIGILFDGKKWKEIDSPKDIKMMFQWNDYFFVDKKVDNGLDIILAIQEKDKTIKAVPFFSWLAPPHRTYVTEMINSIIYITNLNVLDNEFLVAKFDKNTKTWKSFLFRNFDKNGLCSAHVDRDGYIWLHFNCFNRDSDGVLLPLQNTLYRLSPNIFDDYQASQETP